VLVASLQASSEARLPSRDMSLAVPVDDMRGGCFCCSSACLPARESGAAGAMRMPLTLLAWMQNVPPPAQTAEGFGLAQLGSQ
jgi:hypothetical protein